METASLFNLGFDHWQALLLSLIPAVITLSCIIYFSKFPPYKINKVYLLFLFSLFSWQVNDCFSRMSLSEETARSWDKLLSLFWMMVIPAGLQWVMLFTGRRKLTDNYWFIILLYLPAFIFSALLSSGIFSQAFTFSPFWGWVRTYEHIHSPIIIPVLWFLSGISLTMFFFASFAYKNRRSPELKLISLLIFIGYTIPALQAMITQIFFPLLLNMQPVPLTSTLMLTIVIVIIEIKAYKMFYLSETLNSERIAEMIQEIIFVVSPQRAIIYINPYGARQMQISPNGKTARDLFSYSGQVYTSFEKQVLQPAFRKTTPANFQFAALDKKGNEQHWDISTYPMISKKKTTGLLVICRDVSEHVVLGETRLSALRSQMNPHFIFNSLNAIQHYIHSGQREMAESFLSTFSLLIRNILDSSTKTAIPLSEELSTLELYLKLENVRFGGSLSYKIHVDENLDFENILVPSMIIQPYVENAIIHGIAPKPNGGIVTINLIRKSEWILCIIEDNGIGREKAAALQRTKGLKSKSHGMNITQARLDILNQHLNVPVSVEITDLFDGPGQGIGTRVTVYIPVNERF